MVLLAFAEGTKVDLIPDGTLFIHIALILIMIWILNRTFFRPINRIIEAREKNKGGRLGESEMLLKEVGEKEAQYNQSLRDARSKGYEAIEAARAESISAKQEKVGAVKEEVEQKMTQETANLEAQSAQARQIIAAEAEKMAEKISSNILKV